MFPEEQSTLILKNYQALSVLVGDYFEVLNAKIINAHVLGVNGKISICPDLLLKKAKTVVEVKGAGVRGCKIHISQLEKYKRLKKKGYEIWYSLNGYYSRYTSMFKSLPERTYSCFLSYLASNTQFSLILDFDVVNALINTEHIVEYEKWNDSWLTKTSKQWMLYASNPAGLLNDLGLDVKEYVIIQTYATGLEIEGNIVAPFPVTFIIKREECRISIGLDEFETLRSTLESEREFKDETPF